MMRGVWVGALVFLVAGWSTDLTAQPAVWHAAAPPGPFVPPPEVTLGRPQPIGSATDDTDHSRPVPPAPSGIVPVGYQTAAGGPVRTSVDVIAASTSLPGWPGEENVPAPVASAGAFASERSPAAVGVTQVTHAVPAAGVDPEGAPAPPTPANLGGPLAPTDPIPPEDGIFGSFAGDGFGVLNPFGGPPNPMQPHFYISGEYLLWSVKGQQLPPLVTTSAPQDLGFLGQPTTRVLYGDSSAFGGLRSGARFRAGYYLDPYCEEGVEFSGFFLGNGSGNFAANSNQFPVLARPFFSLNTNSQFSELIALPGQSTGSVAISTPSSLWGAMANMRYKCCCGCNYRVGMLVGFRYLDLRESIIIEEQVTGTAQAAAPFTNATDTVTDRFSTYNHFYGGNIGADARYLYGRWTFDLRAMLGIGGTHTDVVIDGSQRLVAADGTVTDSKGGLLALPSNIGHFSSNHFSIVPEIGLNAGYQITPHLRAFLGYNFLYWTGVVRPASVIDRNIDVTQIPNFPVAGATPVAGAHPAAILHATDFYAQGMTFGLEFLY